VIDRQIETLKFLITNALGQWNHRRTYEWRALLGFLAVALSSGSLIATNKPEWLRSSDAKCLFTIFFLLAAGAVIWYLVALQLKNRDEAQRLRDLDEELLRLNGVDQRFRVLPYTMWAPPPQLTFIVIVSLAILSLLWGAN
jgi:hypothetical protein